MSDLIRFIFREDRLSEIRIELALTVLRYAGRTLRGDYPGDFKEMLSFVGGAATRIEGGEQEASEGSQIRTRVDYLLRELQDLKNNKVSFAVMDRFDAVRTWLRVTPLLKGKKVTDQQLTVPFQFLQDQPPAGWPSAGSGFAGGKRPAVSIGAPTGTNPLRAQAIAQRLSTELRQGLFVALMGAEDFEHAAQRVATVADSAKSGAEEACLVIFHCAVREKAPNPFYEHVAVALCVRPAPGGKRFAHCFKRAAVQHLQQAHSYGLRAAVDLAELCAALMADPGTGLTLAVLRFVRFGEGGAKGGGELGSVLGLLLRHLLESLLHRLPDAAEVSVAFKQLERFSDVREGLLLVLDGHVQPRLPSRHKAPLLWEKLQAAKRELSTSGQGD